MLPPPNLPLSTIKITSFCNEILSLVSSGQAQHLLLLTRLFSDMQEGHLTLFLRAVDLLDGQKSCESITIILYDASGVALSILSVKWNLSDYED